MTLSDDFPSDLNKQEDPQWRAKVMRSISLFAYFTEEELADLYLLGQMLHPKTKANVVIEGEPSRGLYLILQGTVAIYKRDPISNQLIRLNYLEHGAAFGELSLFDHSPRAATITAESACTLLFFDHGHFGKYLDKKGDNLKARFFQKCAEETTERLRAQNTDYLASQHLLWKYALRKD